MTNSHIETLRLASIAGDLKADSHARLVAARDCDWIVKSSAVGEPFVTLTRAVLSWLVDDLKKLQKASSTFEHFEFWRNFAISDSNGLSDTAAIPPAAARTCAELLFQGGRHGEASSFFERALSTAPSAEMVILACYNFEILGRSRRDLASVERALTLLKDRFGLNSIEEPYRSEVHHLRGHLLLQKGRLSRTKALGYEMQGVQSLEIAAKADPSYYACYVSSFAEYGDFLSTIETCLKTIADKPYSSLDSRDAKLVELEILFYLAYSFMAVGELERARTCFESFSGVADRLGLFEARDHARLFLVKLALKRRPLLDQEEHTLDRFYGELRSLSFRAALSIPVEFECNRYELIVKLLASLVRIRKRTQVDETTLAEIASLAESLLEHLCNTRSGLFEDINIGVGPSDQFGGVSDGIIALVRERTRRIAKISAFDAVAVKSADGHKGKFSFLLWIAKEWPEEVRSAMSPNVIPIVEVDDERNGIPNSASAVHLLIIGVALIAMRRIWNEDQYVFGLVPCLESPATKYQHPKIDLGRVLKDT